MNKTGARVHRFFRGTSRKPAGTRGREGESRIDLSMTFKVPRTRQRSRVCWKVRMVTRGHILERRSTIPVPFRTGQATRWSSMVGTGTKLWTVMKIAQNHRTPQLRFGAAWAARRTFGSGVGHADDDPKWWDGCERGSCSKRRPTAVGCQV